jgi:hypothetical protein
MPPLRRLAQQDPTPVPTDDPAGFSP